MLRALQQVVNVRRAFATRHLRRGNTLRHPLIEAVAPLVEAIGGEIIAAGSVQDGDVPLTWEGEVVGGVRLRRPALIDLNDHIVAVERQLGGALVDLSREDKQRAVKLLEERGAFKLRKSVEDVAAVLGVSRFTVYNYLSRQPSDQR
jgi:hypothetical protein